MNSARVNSFEVTPSSSSISSTPPSSNPYQSYRDSPNLTTGIDRELSELADNLNAMNFAGTTTQPTSIPWGKILRVPEFDGTERSVEAVDYWLFRVEQFSSYAAITETDKLRIATANLGKTANLWWRSLGLNAPTTWNDFVERFKRQYYPANHEQAARDHLFHCKQTKTVGEYVDRFRQIILGIPTITTEEAMDKFVRGLKRHLQEAVRLQNISSLDEAYALADKVERVKGAISIQNSFNISSSYSSYPRHFSSSSGNRPSSSSYGIPMELGAIQEDQTADHEEQQHEKDFDDLSEENDEELEDLARKKEEYLYALQKVEERRNSHRQSQQRNERFGTHQKECWHCHRPGHFRINCPLLKRSQPTISYRSGNANP